MSEQLWNLADICATTRYADDMVVRTPDDKDWSTTIGKLRSLPDDVIANASNAATWSESRAILNAGAIAQMRAAETFVSPNGWQIALDRAASTTPESTHDERARQERDYRAAQERWYAGEADRVAAMRAARGIPEPRFAALSADELAKAPDPYSEGLRLLRERDARAAAARENR